MKIDLITGFLGAGKTTFIHHYARYLIRKGLHICILENDYGAVNVDMMFLQDLLSEQCELEMVIGGDGYEAHRRRFKTKLISMAMMGYDRVIVEPSGIYDVDEFFDCLHEEPLDRMYEIGSIIAVIDPTADMTLSEETQYLMASQIANAGCIVMSKADIATDQMIANARKQCDRIMDAIGCERQPDNAFIISDLSAMTDDVFEKIMQSGFRSADHIKRQVERDNSFQSLFYFYAVLDPAQLLDLSRRILRDPECGRVLRIKGSVKLEDHKWFNINATREQTFSEYTDRGQEAIVVIGESLQREKIDSYLLTYARYSGMF